MSDRVSYNQIICIDNTFLNVETVKKSFLEKRELVLILENSKKIIIPGNSIDTSGNKNRINELVSMAEEKGFNIQEKSVKHYAKDEDNEYVLVRW
jgi:hypothetical protein